MPLSVLCFSGYYSVESRSVVQALLCGPPGQQTMLVTWHYNFPSPVEDPEADPEQDGRMQCQET
jgi:hypothetical protein